ncbi:hypothetical protein PABG_12108 [Paracoccidioides brasiliensis Pb03]|nr:hypothetical protein PABG_12108 [Paracoccidioides brasiliensis Pb03]
MEALLAGKMSRRTCTASREHLRQVLQVGLRKRALVSTQPLEGFSSGKPPGDCLVSAMMASPKRHNPSHSQVKLGTLAISGREEEEG